MSIENLADEEKSIVVPLMLGAGILVVILLLLGIFMPTVSWSF